MHRRPGLDDLPHDIDALSGHARALRLATPMAEAPGTAIALDFREMSARAMVMRYRNHLKCEIQAVQQASRRFLAALSGSSIHLVTSAVCLACVFDGEILDRDAALGVIGLTVAQLPIGVLQYFYAESLRAGRTPRERVRHFGRQWALILVMVALFGGPYLTVPDAAIGVAWALVGVVVSLFAAGGDVELEAHRALALAEDAFDFFGMVMRVATAVGIVIVFTAAVMKVEEMPTPRLFALIPAVYFALLSASVFNAHGEAFARAPASLSRRPCIRWLVALGTRAPRSSARAGRRRHRR